MSQAHSYLINGSFNQAISPFDRGFAYGDGVFRTLKMINGQPQHWPQHYQKLVADCAAISIVCPSADLLISDLAQLFKPVETAVAKIIITRGEGERGYAAPAVTMPLRAVIKSNLPQYPETNYTNGVELLICETRLNAQPKLAGIKHLNRLENVLARMEWNNEAIFDGLMLDAKDNVIECTMGNIFAQFGDILITPDLSECGVAGITRQQIINHAAPLNKTIKPAQLSLSQLVKAEEVIVCNSLYGAFQVSKIGTNIFLPGNLAKKIRELLAHD
ncbi:MAG: aminodeoxychorismate lyase [Methylotenera sp.]|nr:aminodeoxychorismate lyase [Methylotenera sp.]